jgi:endonuclease/exonuclease/phosphatase family metal-dependent hydrolase
VLIRTWNVFHGNTNPPQRRAYLREVVELAVGDDPDVVCLQELPAWSLSRLAAWTAGYAVAPALAAPPTLGPLPSTVEIGRVLTSLNAGLLRSAFSGQGNAILVSPRLQLREQHVCVLNPPPFRRAQAKSIGVGPLARLAWANERRVCQAVRLWDGTRTLLVANLHATSYPPDERLADAELLRAFAYVDGLADRGEPVAVAGDFNVTFARSRTLFDLMGEEWGFSQPGPGIDQILVRNLEITSGPTRWPPERRERHGALLSDHVPVEVVVE